MNQDYARNAQAGRGYAPIGQTPEIQPSTGRVSVNGFVASISNQGKVRFMLYTQKLTAQVFIPFLERLIAQRRRKLDCGQASRTSFRGSTTVAYIASSKN